MKRKKDTGQNTDPDINFNEETQLLHCPTAGCATTAKYKYNIVKYLKSSYSVNKCRKRAADDKICKACGKVFAKTSNRDRYFQQFHTEINHDIAKYELPTMVPENELLTMVTLISLVDVQIGEGEEPAVSEFDDLHELSHDDAASNVDEKDDIFEDSTVTETQNESPSNQHAAKRSRLENVIGKITSNVGYSISFNQCVIDKLHNDLKNSKTVAVECMRSCFELFRC